MSGSRLVLAGFLIISLASCATVEHGSIRFLPSSFSATAQKGALSRAKRAYSKKDFEACLGHLDRAETYGTYAVTVRSQIAFNKGLCLEGQGREAEAQAVYRSLVQKDPDSTWAAQARGRL
jgi:hypothetical protein